MPSPVHSLRAVEALFAGRMAPNCGRMRIRCHGQGLPFTARDVSSFACRYGDPVGGTGQREWLVDRSTPPSRAGAGTVVHGAHHPSRRWRYRNRLLLASHSPAICRRPCCFLNAWARGRCRRAGHRPAHCRRSCGISGRATPFRRCPSARESMPRTCRNRTQSVVPGEGFRQSTDLEHSVRR